MSLRVTSDSDEDSKKTASAGKAFFVLPPEFFFGRYMIIKYYTHKIPHMNKI